MAEFVQSIGAAALWFGAFLLLVAGLNRGAGRSPLSLRAWLVAFPLFFFLQITFVKLLHLGGVLTPAAALAGYGAAVVIGGGWLFAARRRGPRVPDGTRADWFDRHDPDEVLVRRIVVVCVGLMLAGLALFSLVTPLHVWDVQAYHMPMVASYVRNESLAAWATQDLRQVYRVNAGELQLLNLALLSRSDTWLELPNILALAVSLVAVFEIGRLVLPGRSSAYLPVVLVLTAPQIVAGAVTAKNDVVFMALILCAFYWTVRLVTGPGASSRGVPLVMLGLTVSLAAATKVMGLNVLGTVGLVLLALALTRQLSMRGMVLFGVAGLVFLLASAGDVYLGNLARTSVPVGIAPGEVRFTVGPANLVAAAKYYLYDLSFKRLVTVQVFEHDFGHFGYFFPLMLVLGVWAAIRQVVTSRERNVGVLVLAALSAVLFASIIAARLPIYWDQRFMTWMVPAAAILSVFLLKASGRLLLVAVACFGAFAVINLIQLYTNESDGLFARSAGYLLRQGRVPRLIDVPHEKYRYMFDGFEVLESEAGERDSVLYVGGDDTWMYPSWGRRFTRYVSGVQDADDVRSRVASGVYAFVVIEDQAADEVKGAACAAAEEAGYLVLEAGEGRNILKRRRPGPDAAESYAR